MLERPFTHSATLRHSAQELPLLWASVMKTSDMFRICCLRCTAEGRVQLQSQDVWRNMTVHSGYLQWFYPAMQKKKGKKEWINDRNLKQGSFQITHWAQIWFPAEAYESPLLVPGQNCTSFLGAIRPAQVSTSDSSDKAFSLKVSRRTQARWKMSPTKKEQKIGKEVSISIQQEGKYSLGAERSQKALPTLRFNCHTQIIITKKNRDCTFKSGIKRRLYIGSFMCKSVCSVRQVQAEAAA